MSQQTAKEILMDVLSKTPMKMTEQLIIMAVFNLCAPNPSQVITHDQLAKGMQELCNRLGLPAKVYILPTSPEQQENAANN